MAILPPGTILQLMYLRERLAKIRPGRFIEIGPGAGNISSLLLSMGWQGTAYDLEPLTVAKIERRFSGEIASGRYKAKNQDWLKADQKELCDLVISCMVMEHFDERGERQFIDRARQCLKYGGQMISIVPGSPKHWGIEDEIAGHYRRYTADSARSLLSSAGWDVKHTAGLTFPLSNILFPLSNFLVHRSEALKLELSMLERTKKSGIRDVPMKTKFPRIFWLILNRWTMFPLHILQKIFRKSHRAMVIYVEATPPVLP
ncbi:class I SAM-dependent methyltransferase [Collimonas humicola]|uniref:class I SAM-dependent methyltransferase n=1 Tax=Collimonas humicola TaxID=2825886 RepID=UPI001B8C53B8|nr:methyltransferase domain-containing protein [Collimonas humicola]